MISRLGEGTIPSDVQFSSARSERAAVGRIATRLGLSSTPAIALLYGVGLAAAAGVLAALRGFDGLYGQDAYAYFDYSTTSVRQSILHLSGLESFFWPPGYPILVALISLVTGPVPLAGQAVSLVMGALVPVLTTLLVREARERGLLAYTAYVGHAQLAMRLPSVLPDPAGRTSRTYVDNVVDLLLVRSVDVPQRG